MDKQQIAIKRLQEAALMSKRYYEKPLHVQYSGGKDSDVLLHLAKKSGIDFVLEHSHTTADAPETVRHVAKVFTSAEQDGIKCHINIPMYKGKRTSMWHLIVAAQFPPTRQYRYCCGLLKESNSKNTLIATGVRWAESPRRRKNSGIYQSANEPNKAKRIMLVNDNDDKCMLYDRCIQKK